MSAQSKGGEGRGTTKEIVSSDEQNALRRASKQGRNRKTKGTMQIDHTIPANLRLDQVGGVRARQRAAMDKARQEEARKEFARQRTEAILRERKKEYGRKGEAMLVLRKQMNEAEDEFDTLKGNLATASDERKPIIKTRMRKLESTLRGMERRRDALKERLGVLEGMIFEGKPLVEARS